MKNWIPGYKKFINNKVKLLKENEQISINSSSEKEKQIKAFEQCEKDGIVKFIPTITGRIGTPNREFFWSEKDHGIIFEGDLFITYKFEGKSLSELPFKMVIVSGEFDCSGIYIEDLIGCPQNVTLINASHCTLKTLKGSPEMVGDFNVEGNLLTRISEGPDYVFGNFIVRENMLKSLDNGPLLIDGEIGLMGNPKINKEGLGILYDKMHKDIRNNYGNGSWRSLQNDVKKDIEEKNYIHQILVKNPDYEKFLGRFKEEIGEWQFLKNTKQFGLI